MCFNRVYCLVFVLLFCFTVFGKADEADRDLALNEKLLKDAGIPTDGPSLLAFLKARTLSNAEREQLAGKVKLLGSEDFEEREKAQKSLLAGGRFAVPILKEALTNPDLEIRRRAEVILESIERNSESPLIIAVGTLLAHQKPAGSIETILAFLPGISDEYAEEALVRALRECGIREGKVDEAVLRAVGDKNPTVRWAVATVVGAAEPELRKRIYDLLKDGQPRVRFRAASALIRGGDKKGVSAMIEMLQESESGFAWQAEDLLFRMAGGKAPNVTLADGSREKREAARKAWEQWWKEQADTLDFTKLQLETALRGVYVICEEGTKTIRECNKDGTLRWEVGNVGTPSDVELLPNGNILYVDYHSGQVREITREGKEVWSQKAVGSSTTCKRLANGNTFVSGYSEIAELSPKGEVVKSIKNNAWNAIYRSEKLRNGNILFICSAGKIIELTPDGKEVRSIPVKDINVWAGIELLPNGNFLVCSYGGNKVAEIDPSGKEMWQFSINSPSQATKLSNGNILVSSMDGKRIVEADTKGKEIAKIECKGRPFGVRKY